MAGAPSAVPHAHPSPPDRECRSRVKEVARSLRNAFSWVPWAPTLRLEPRNQLVKLGPTEWQSIGSDPYLAVLGRCPRGWIEVRLRGSADAYSEVVLYLD